MAFMQRATRDDHPAQIRAPREATSASWRARRVTVMGLGRHGGGLGAVRFLVRQGARVTISDLADREALAESLESLGDLKPAAVNLGGHDREDFRDADAVVVNPAVRPDHPCLELARRSGAVLTSEIELFLRACPATVIGVTGSNGKSTTCAMLASILLADRRRTWLGGNFGGSLLENVDEMGAEDWVVLELSSFQLAHLSRNAPLPRFAAVTNCTPNHLDWHGSFHDYVRAKQRLFVGQPPDAVAVLDPHGAEVSSWASLTAGRAHAPWALDRFGPLAASGLHNRRNAACAAALAEAAGVEDATIRACLAQYCGLDHRLQFVAEVAGRRFYNDSKATTPEATLAALDALGGRVWLLAGGRSKGAALDPLAQGIARHALGAGLFGASRETLRRLVRSCRADFAAHATEHLADALAWCWRLSRPGDTILLSPGCASHDQFRDFVARGETFCRLVGDLASRAEK